MEWPQFLMAAKLKSFSKKRCLFAGRILDTFSENVSLLIKELIISDFECPYSGSYTNLSSDKRKTYFFEKVKRFKKSTLDRDTCNL